MEFFRSQNYGIYRSPYGFFSKLVHTTYDIPIFKRHNRTQNSKVGRKFKGNKVNTSNFCWTKTLPNVYCILNVN